MIALKVASYNGAPADGPAAQFDELGGSIGRADTNQLVLPDPERTISRVHARVIFRAGGYCIVDNGSNPISVNGRVLGSGREAPLRAGDEVQIGGYVLRATDNLAPAVSDPFADLFGDAAGLATPVAAPLWPPASPAGPAGGSPAAFAAPRQAAPPRAQPPAPSAPAWPPAASPAPPASRAPAPAAFAPGHIPEDWDPFAPDPQPAASGVSPATPAAQGGGGLLDLPAQRADSLDDLFGLGPGAPSADPLKAFGGAPAPARSDLLGPAPAADPFGLGGNADGGSELNTPMPLPPEAPAAPAAWAARAEAPRALGLPAGAVFSWQDPPRDGRVVTVPGVRREGVDPPVAPQPMATGLGDFGLDLPLDPPQDTPGAAPPVAADPAPQTQTPASRDRLLQALLEGLDTPGLRLGALDEATMRLIGQLLRESTRGAVELLVARAALKREMRAEMTMIVARENNPLKFSPSVEVALQHLLGPPTPGFMPAAPAVRDAFDDLRAHQLGVMAGMRAALEGVLQRFDPQQLEGKLAHRSKLASLIPAARKARLWELFQELFGQLQREAEDDFDELFGRAFVRAYEAQLDRLQSEPGPR